MLNAVLVFAGGTDVESKLKSKAKSSDFKTEEGIPKALEACISTVATFDICLTSTFFLKTSELNV